MSQTAKTIPANAKKPQDRQAAKSEASGDTETITFTYDDREWSYRSSAVNDVEILEFVEDGKITTALRKILGADQWSDWKDIHRLDDGTVPPEDMEDFTKAIFEAGGQGN